MVICNNRNIPTLKGVFIMIQRLVAVFSIPSYALLFLCMLLQGVATSLYMPYLSIYFTDNLAVTVQMYGLFLAINLIAGIGVSSFIGKRSDIGMNRKYIYIFATVCNALAYCGYIFIDNFIVLFVYMTVFTALGASGLPQLFAISREAVNKSNFNNHSFANSTLRSAFSLGFILGPLVGALLIRGIGIKGIFAGTVIVFIIIACLITLFLKATSKLKKANVQATVNQKFKLKKHPIILITFSILTLMYTAHWMSSLNTALFITNHIEGTTGDVGLISSICAALEIPFMLMLGVVGGKYSNRLIILVGAVLVGIYYIIIILSTEMWQIIGAQLLLAVFVSIISATGISYIQDMLPNMPGYASTLYSNSSTIGRLFGSLFGGIVASVVGYRYSFILCFLLIVFAIVLLISAQNRSIEAKQSIAS